MSESSNLNDEFKLISYKKKGNKQKNKVKINLNAPDNSSFDLQSIKRRIHLAKEDFLSSNIYISFKASIIESLQVLKNPKISEIVCFGLGKISECITSRYQLQVLLYLKDLFNVNVYVYDPIFTDFERILLNEFQLSIIPENSEGKYNIKDSGSTIFYLPHCPKQLTNNVLWRNWGLQLNKCIFISNSFHKIVENNTKRVLADTAFYINKILPHTCEVAIINEFRFYEIFNDTAIHIFPLDKLLLLPEDFWLDCDEPKYSTEDIEFITSTFTSKLNI